MKPLVLPSLFSLLLISCYSTKSYNPYYWNLNRTTKEKFKPTKQISSYDLNENNLKYFTQNGYIMIGYDALRHTYIGYQEAVNAGCWIGASVMLYKHEYVGTASGTAVVPYYNPGEVHTINSKTSGSVNAYGSSSFSAYGSGGYAYGSSYSRGYGTYNSNTTTTISTPGSFSYYSVPYAHDYYDQYAFYLVKKYYRVERDAGLFQRASYESKVVATIKANEWFEIVSFGERYNKVSYQGKVGYIIAKLPIQ